MYYGPGRAGKRNYGPGRAEKFSHFTISTRNKLSSFWHSKRIVECYFELFPKRPLSPDLRIWFIRSEPLLWRLWVNLSAKTCRLYAFSTYSYIVRVYSIVDHYELFFCEFIRISSVLCISYSKYISPCQLHHWYSRSQRNFN